MQSKVEICGVNTAHLPVLKNEETEQLLLRSRDGDKVAREQLIAGNLRLVLSVIQRFTRRGENVDDLFQVGCIGLIKAIDNFDPKHEVRFSTYGVPTVIEWRKRERVVVCDTQAGHFRSHSSAGRDWEKRRSNQSFT